jgi:hypothetical protein
LSNKRTQLRGELDATVFDLERTPDAEATIRLIEALLDAGEPIDDLIDRYALAREPDTMRSLSFVLARRASNGPDRAQLAAPVWRLAEHLQGDDDTTRINLLTAIQLLAAYDVLLGVGREPCAIFSTLLLDSLAGSPAVQHTVVPLIRALHLTGVLARMPPDTLAAVQRRLQALTNSEDKILQDELQELPSFLLRAP